MAVYDVGPGKTYATIQAAADQVVIDAGGSDFTEEREIRIYDGMYTETVLLNAALRPLVRHKLKINAASGNTAVILTNTGLSASALDCGAVDSIVVRGIAIRNYYAGAVYCIKSLGGGNLLEDIAFEGYGADRAHHNTVFARRCIYSGFTVGIYAASGIFEQCRISGGYVYTYPAAGIPLTMHGCNFDGCYIILSSGNTTPSFATGPQVLNCTFYNVARALFAITVDHLDCRVINCIFEKITNCVFDGDAGTGRIVSDHNVFHDCGKIGRMNGIDYTSLADWRAFVDEDGNSPDEHSIEADPLLVDPGSDDFSWPEGSPVQHAGQGSGVIRGYNGVKFDRFRPDIGSYSSGPAPLVPVRYGAELVRVLA